MEYNIEHATDVLSRTPRVLEALLTGLSDEWIYANEGTGTWSPVEVIGHLIVNEETNFMVRTKIILRGGLNPVLQPINMTEHLERFRNTSVATLLKTFNDLRQQNLKKLQALTITNEDLFKTALHPKVGMVQLRNVLSTWVAHDLVHVGQITRVMAKQYKQEVGPFLEFLPRLR